MGDGLPPQPMATTLSILCSSGVKMQTYMVWAILIVICLISALFIFAIDEET